MDCDFTHDPARIPALLAKAREGFDVVVGSRYLSRPEPRRLESFPQDADPTGPLDDPRLPRDELRRDQRVSLLPTWSAIPSHLFALVGSQGYSFFFESLYVLHRNRFQIGEIPIALPNRTYGHSKMDFAEIRNSMRLLVVTCFKAFFNPEKFEVGEDFSPTEGVDGLKDEQGWDSYWENQKKAGGLLYDAIAAFYRKFIIRPSLNRFARPPFPARAQRCCTPAVAAARSMPTSAAGSPSPGSTCR